MIVGFGAACEVATARHEEDQARIDALTTRLQAGLWDINPSIRLFGHAKKRITGSLNIGFPGIPAEEIIRNVADRVAVSTGSACASATSEPSKVLLALGLDPQEAATGVRISLGRFTTEQEVEAAISALSEFAVFSYRN